MSLRFLEKLAAAEMPYSTTDEIERTYVGVLVTAQLIEADQLPGLAVVRSLSDTALTFTVRGVVFGYHRKRQNPDNSEAKPGIPAVD